MPDRHAALTSMPRTLKLPSVADSFADLALRATKASLSHETFLYELVQAE